MSDVKTLMRSAYARVTIRKVSMKLKTVILPGNMSSVLKIDNVRSAASCF